MFRSIDMHGQVSNPTHVFEVEMVDDGGAVYQTVEVIAPPFEVERISQPSRPMKRFLQIKPAYMQSILDTGWSAGPRLGKTKGSRAKGSAGLWEKRFKVRLVSRDTCKKIDLNLSYKFKFEGFDALNELLQLNDDLKNKDGVKTSTLYTLSAIDAALNGGCDDDTSKPGDQKTALSGMPKDESSASEDKMKKSDLDPDDYK